jgi:hypothetical protein
MIMVCFEIVLLNKTTIINNPYTEFGYALAQYIIELKYLKKIFTNLLFCSKSRFLSAGG